MKRLTRRSLLGGLTVAGAGALLPTASHATTPTAAPATTGAATTAQAGPTPLQQPPAIQILTPANGTAEGLLFVTPQGFFAPNAARGPLIVDNNGQPVWFRSIPTNTFATDFRVQTYQGEPVLTWWEGTVQGAGIGNGSGYIANANYEVIATVGQGLDLHEFLLTEDGTAFVIKFEEVPADLSSVGGPSNGTVWDCIVQELDVATGQPVFEWRGSEHVPVNQSDIPYPGFGAYDYLHTNSVGIDTDGNLLISCRHASAVYKVDRATGEILWALGGSNSSFQMGQGTQFTGQHDGQSEGNNVYRLFNNGVQVSLFGERLAPMQQAGSSVKWIEVDSASGTASLVNEITHPEGIQALAEGGAYRLPNDNVLVSWGQGGRITEHSPTNQLVFEAALPQGMSSYRAYRMEWQGQPATDPEVVVDDKGDIHAVWNGATGVATWRVLGGEAEVGLRSVAETPWRGLDTTVRLPESVRRDTSHLRVQALDRRGRVLGTSGVTAVDDVGRTER